MDNAVTEYLAEVHGITVGHTIYRHIAEWDAWRRGYYKPFHSFMEGRAGGVPVMRELYRLNMAQKICEDWASLLFGEHTYICAEDAAASDWLSGVDGEHGFMADTSLIRRSCALAEKAFALGTGCAVLRIDGAVVADGQLLPSPSARLRIETVDAQCIVPISVGSDGMTEAAFVSEINERGRALVYLELHRLESDGYVITNEWLERRDGALVRIEQRGGIPHVIHTHSPVPLFAVLTPAVTNCIDERCGLGASIFAQATDCLRGVDLAFNNFCRDLKLGGKKVFINRSLVVRDEAGNTFTPDDVAQQLFMTVGDSDLAEETMISEHNPSLRTEENANAVQHQLDYLSFRCGLGTRHYLFSGVQGKAQLTATQYTGERQDLIQNTARHRLSAEKYLISVARAALWAARYVLGVPLDEKTPLKVRFDDSYFIDSESERERDRAEVAAGLMLPHEFRMKWRGESERTARRMLSRGAADGSADSTANSTADSDAGCASECESDTADKAARREVIK